ncbi:MULTISPECIES: TfuA-like protein [Glycomyces]|uniref:TfuA-like protein n=2 Tax=Glycomyces TaxID=58113 RepID=A0A9X3SY92_9ACTN|nr:TfuA-like protein [Glycomyces lechevalierae]MDA1385996.1 TfuA-like protein [Glycomyces lechevalierae]MDR7340847.1 hypothetical protein [Glycomyces lechevalierae]
MTQHVFCGPTLSGDEVRAVVPDAIVHPPIRHGDALRLDTGPGDIVLIVDGVFHQSAAVRHKEILALIAARTAVAGCSSMGALRAAELDAFGMIGIGEVYRRYRSGETDADADVAVTHTQGGRIEQLSLAMVDLEAHLDDACRDGAVDRGEHAALAAALRGVHYTERSPQRFAALRAPGIDAFRAWLDARPDLRGAKHRDALTALRLLAEDGITTAAPGPWTKRAWRTEYLRDWTARHRGIIYKGRHITRTAHAQYRQIFDPEHPRRRRRLVLSWIGGATGPDDRSPQEVLDAALDAAAASGLRLADLTPEQRRHWLTADEDDLEPAEALARILVRSTAAGPVTPGSDWPQAAPDSAITAAIAHAFAVNDRAAAHGVTIDGLETESVRTFLRGLWGLDGADPETLTAAARDRGFRNFEGAAEICRQFILAELGDALWHHLDPRM